MSGTSSRCVRPQSCCCRQGWQGRAPPTDIAGSCPITNSVSTSGSHTVDLVDHRPRRRVVQPVDIAHRRLDPRPRQRLAGAGGRGAQHRVDGRGMGAQPVACQSGFPYPARGQRALVIGHSGRVVRLRVPKQQQRPIAVGHGLTVGHAGARPGSCRHPDLHSPHLAKKQAGRRVSRCDSCTPPTGSSG